jgi:hypothetical protein
MARSPLFGRRIHIAGSIDTDPAVASAADVDAARDFVTLLTAELLALGATFVVPSIAKISDLPTAALSASTG